jgi:hypothetical protein
MSRPRVVVYRHPAAGFSLPLPAEWERIEDAQPGVPLIAVEPEHGGGFRANVVVTIDELPSGLDLDGWQAGAEEGLPDALQGYLLLDREHLVVGGRDAIRRLAHHAMPDRGSITMEQWTLVSEGRGITLTASAATLEYDGLAATFAGIAGELSP